MAKLANATIPVEEASIQRRQLTVEVLTLDKRQVTQSLYKQIVEEDVIDQYTGTIKGIVWGWVNLHNDCHHMNGEHFHAIWEDNGNLKRSYVCLPWTKKIPYYQHIRTHEEVARGKPYYDQLVEKCKGETNKIQMGTIWELSQLREKWEQSYQEIKDTGQLFIAVSGVWK